MGPLRTTRLGTRLGVLAAFLLAAATLGSQAAEPDRLAAAKAAVQKAAAEEKVAHTEWYSREMARSATREIGVSARSAVDRATQALIAAHDNLKEKQAAAADVAAAQKSVTVRLNTARAAADRMMNEQRIANEATDNLLVIERRLADKMAATRAAERAVLALEADAAKAEAAKPQKDKAAAEKARAAERAVLEADVVALWEAQAWLGVHRSTLQQMSGGNANAVEVATKLAGLEPDKTRAKALQDFATRMTALKETEDKQAAEKSAAMQAMDWKIYVARAAAAGGLKPLDPARWDLDKARHLLVRAGFGGTPQEVARLHAMGLQKAVDHLVDFHRHPMAEVPFDAAPPTRSDPLEAKVRNDFVRGQVAAQRRGNEGSQFGRLRQWWLRRMVESPRPLQEKLTLFWHGHFATQYSVVQNSYTTYHQNQLFREHAAGNFGGLLRGLVHDPVMIRYLDNNTNVKGHANENLAREIMELFALGAYQGYDEKDVREAARALTGYNFDPQTGQFRFIVAQHDEGKKTIFGKTGNWTGDDLVNLLLDHPQTARFISKKLFEYFVYDEPSPETVDRLANVMRGYQYDLTPMLKNLFLSEEFYNSRAMGTQIKCPIQLVAGTLRDLGVKKVADAGALDAAVRSMGQELFEPPDVKGWRYGRPWINTNRIFVRYNAIADLVRNVSQPGGKRGVDMVAFFEGSACQSPAQVVDHLARACLPKPLSDSKRQELIAYLADLPACSEWSKQRQAVNEKLQNLLVLMASMPEYHLN